MTPQCRCMDIETSHPGGPAVSEGKLLSAAQNDAPLWNTCSQLLAPTLGTMQSPRIHVGTEGGEERSWLQGTDSARHSDGCGIQPAPARGAALPLFSHVKWLRFRQRSSSKVTSCTWPSPGRPGCISLRSRGASLAHSVPRRQ